MGSLDYPPSFRPGSTGGICLGGEGGVGVSLTLNSIRSVEKTPVLALPIVTVISETVTGFPNAFCDSAIACVIAFAMFMVQMPY
jgi:hypothetical protein